MGDGLVHRRDGRDGLADKHGLGGEDGSPGRLRTRHVIGRQHGHHAFHLQRLGGIDVAHPGMGHGAGQQPAKQHTVGAEILSVFRFARDLGPHVRRREVLAQQIVSHAALPAARITAFK